MAKNFHSLQGIGRLGALPEMRYTPSGLEVTNISVATSDDYYDRTEEEWQERTLWLRMVAMGPLAEKIAERYDKGDKVFYQASLRNTKYEKDGVEVHTYDFKINYIELLEKANKNKEEFEGANVKPEPSTVEEEAEDDLPPWD